MNSSTDNLQVYLVGGAVRDELAGLPVSDRDWVVVGHTVEEMLDRGFRPVGKSFPVFLHPTTNEEYALARKEKKVGKGYGGFETISDPSISLEEDLARRDLTINAIARDNSGLLIDPYDGKGDLEAGLLRHVSTAFAEDPLRVLRVARFAARFHAKGFKIHDETMALMRELVESGEVNDLTAERVWQEFLAAMKRPHFSRFIQELKNCGALKVILPEVDSLFGVPQTKKYHPEIDTGIHTLMALDAVQNLTLDPVIIFAVLVHDLGKGVTPENEWPSHKGHEKAGIPLVEGVCNRLRVGNEFKKLSRLVCEFHLLHHQFDHLKPAKKLRLLQSLDGFRNPDMVEKFCQACVADMRGRLGRDQAADTQRRNIMSALESASSVDAESIATEIKYHAKEKGWPNAELGGRIADAITRERISAIKNSGLKETS